MDRETGFDQQNKVILPGIRVPAGDRAVYNLLKRTIDIIVSTIALILFSPFMLIAAVLIHFDSPGPVIYAQKRVGAKWVYKDGCYCWERTEFTCYKFRTMFNKADSSVHHTYINALINHDEQTLSAIQGSDNQVKKITNDARVTRLGHFLRSSSLDEVPQFWNVLKGDMSVVGPRPAIPYEVELYKPWYFRRLEVKPGITGLWQVGARNSVDFDGMVKLDIEYIDKQSIWLDLKIIFMTPLIMLRRKGVA
jgi:lipopolysaccharide/colanic/teichoic acid biosynthesis glycosyltransferase